MSKNLFDLLGLLVAVCFILALKGLSSPKTARRGNLIGAAGATLATILVFFDPSITKIHNFYLIVGAIVIGVGAGVPAARCRWSPPAPSPASPSPVRDPAAVPSGCAD